MAIATALAAGAVAFGIWAANHLRPKTRRRRAETMVRYYADLLRMLAARGYRLATGETPREFALRFRTHDVLNTLEAITELYYGSRYEGRSLSDIELAHIEEFRRRLKSMPKLAEV